MALPFFGILSCWIYLLASSIRLIHIFKSISIKKKITRINNNKETFPYVSVIVPTRNEQNYIERCLISLMEQNYPNFEIIVIDDDSTDSTLSKIKKIQQKCNNYRNHKQKKYPILKIVELKDKPEGWTGKTWASEQGYLQSHYDLLLFVDADTYFKKNCIRYTISQMLNEELDVLTGYPFIELKDFWSKITIPLWTIMYITFGKNVSNVIIQNQKLHI